MVPPARLLLVWLSIGLQSFGGGAVTLALIRRTLVERHGWIEDAQFAEDLALSQLAPGINQFALALLLGRRIAGWRGAAASLFGLVLPSALATVLLTAGYASVQGDPTAHAALRGIVPATVGLGLLTAFQLARGSLKDSQKAKALPLGVFVLAGSIVAALLGASTVGTLATGAAIGAAGAMLRRSPAR